MAHIIIVLLVSLRALEHGFRLKKDMNTKHRLFKLYDRLFHLFSATHDGLFIAAIYLAGTAKYFYFEQFMAWFVCFVILRFGIFDAIVNACNLDNRTLNYLRKSNWAYKLADKVLYRFGTTSTIWYFKIMATIGVTIYLIFI